MLQMRPIAAALADELFPPEPDAPAGSTIVPDALDDLLASMPAESVKELGIALDLVELGSLPLHGRRFSQLKGPTRTRYIDGWMRSRLPVRRAIFRALRNLFATLYYGDERSWELLGYPGPQLAEAGR